MSAPRKKERRNESNISFSAQAKNRIESINKNLFREKKTEKHSGRDRKKQSRRRGKRRRGAL